MEPIRSAIMEHLIAVVIPVKTRVQRFSSYDVLLMSICIVLFFNGCAVINYDLSPNNTPRGYIEFYNENITHSNMNTWEVWKYEDPNEIKITGLLWSGEERRRISDRPGTHTFIVRIGSFSESVIVDIIEGMIIPVRVRMMRITASKDTYKTANHFKMVLDVEKPIPFSYSGPSP